MRNSVRLGRASALAMLLLIPCATKPSLATGIPPQKPCKAVVFEGSVAEGQPFAQQFSSDWTFYLEPIRSGWMVRVLRAGQSRGDHDAAEVATPPYLSVTPLAVTTDFSFRAQDAIGWNPRRFHYTADDRTFARMVALYPAAMKGSGAAEAELATLTAAQPEGELTIEDAHLLPGSSDQVGAAAAVASHFETTAHSVDQGAASPLGRVTWMKFRVQLEMPAAMKPYAALKIVQVPCKK